MIKKGMAQYFKWFWRFWKQAKWKLVLVLFISALSIFAKTAFPVFLKYIVDMFESDYDPAKLHHLIFLWLIAAFFHELISVALPNFRAFMNLLFTVMIRNSYFKSFTKKNLHFFKKFRTGDLLTRLTDDIDGAWDRISWYSCSGVMRPIEAVLILGFTLSVMLYYSVPLTLYTFIPLPFLVLILSKYEDKMVRFTAEKQKSISECNNVLESCFSGIRVIKTTLSENDQVDKFNKVLDVRIKKEKDFLKMNLMIHFFSMLVNNAGIIIVIFIGSAYVVSGKITLGTLLLFIIYLQRFVEPIWTISWFYASSKQVFRYVDRLKETEIPEFDYPEDTEDKQDIESFESLKVKDLTFTFDDAENKTLNNINFELKKGESLAVVGAVGSGKSTLLEVIAGNLIADCGKIFINDTPLDKISHRSLASTIGYIKQENVLFSETIRNNLELGDNFTEEEIDRSIETSIMTEEIKTFPKGLETVLGQKGLSLSGGQKQRVSIARTLIRRPQLLLMDDCTAAMDANTEKTFWANFRQNMPETTCVIVTHRLATAYHADKVLVIDENRVKEFGTVKDLSRHGTVFMKIMTGDLDHDVIEEIGPKVT
ncbi:MAG: ABC transporter ATP-binding protein [Candidatus Delongbacteria bacterium]